MVLDKVVVDQLAHIVRLELSEKERDSILESLNEILIWLQKLDAFYKDKDAHSLSISIPMQELKKLREDLPIKTLTHETGLKNAPDRDTNYFRTLPINHI